MYTVPVQRSGNKMLRLLKQKKWRTLSSPDKVKERCTETRDIFMREAESKCFLKKKKS